MLVCRRSASTLTPDYRLEPPATPSSVARAVLHDGSAADLERVDVASFLTTLARQENLLTAQGRPDVASLKARIVEGKRSLQLGLDLPERTKWCALFAAEGIPLTHGTWEIVLRDRSVHLAVGGKTSKAARYETVAAAVDLAVAQVRKDTGDDAVSLVQQNRLALRIRGPAREARAAAVQLYLRELVPIEGILACVDVDPQSRTDFFDTFGFAFGTEAVDQLDKAFRDWMGILPTLPTSIRRDREQSTRARYSELLGTRKTALKQPMRLAVIGVAGAGKSTFLNAVLGRSIAPVHTAICTSTNTVFAYASSPANEGLTYTWDRPALHAATERAMRQMDETRPSKRDMIKEFASGASSSRVITEADHQRFVQRHTHLVRVRQRLEQMSGRARLEHLPLLTSTQGEGLSEFVTEVKVHLNVPILQHVELVDTPGMGDADQRRAGMAARSFEGRGAEGAIVVVDASQKAVVDRQRELQQATGGALNRPAVMVLSKIDALQHEAHERREDVIAARKRVYREAPYAWQGPQVEVAAHARVAMGHGPRGPWLDARDRKTPRECLQRMVALSRADAYADELAGDLIKDARNPLLVEAIHDYILDASRVPHAIHELAQACSARVLRARVAAPLRALMDDMQAVLVALDQYRDELQTRRVAAATADTLQQAQARASAARQAVEARLTAVQAKLASVENRPALLEARAREVVTTLGKEQKGAALTALEQLFRAEAAGGLSCTATLPVGPTFAGPVIDQAVARVKEEICVCMREVEATLDVITDPATKKRARKWCRTPFEPDSAVLAPVRDRTFIAEEDFWESFEGTSIPRMRRDANTACDAVIEVAAQSIGRTCFSLANSAVVLLRDHCDNVRRAHEQADQEVRDLTTNRQEAIRNADQWTVAGIDAEITKREGTRMSIEKAHLAPLHVLMVACDLAETT